MPDFSLTKIQFPDFQQLSRAIKEGLYMLEKQNTHLKGLKK